MIRPRCSCWLLLLPPLFSVHFAVRVAATFLVHPLGSSSSSSPCSSSPSLLSISVSPNRNDNISNDASSAAASGLASVLAAKDAFIAKLKTVESEEKEKVLSEVRKEFFVANNNNERSWKSKYEATVRELNLLKAQSEVSQEIALQTLGNELTNDFRNEVQRIYDDLREKEVLIRKLKLEIRDLTETDQVATGLSKINLRNKKLQSELTLLQKEIDAAVRVEESKIFTAMRRQVELQKELEALRKTYATEMEQLSIRLEQKQNEIVQERARAEQLSQSVREQTLQKLQSAEREYEQGIESISQKYQKQIEIVSQQAQQAQQHVQALHSEIQYYQTTLSRLEQEKTSIRASFKQCFQVVWRKCIPQSVRRRRQWGWKNNRSTTTTATTTTTAVGSSVSPPTKPNPPRTNPPRPPQTLPATFYMPE